MRDSLFTSITAWQPYMITLAAYATLLLLLLAFRSSHRSIDWRWVWAGIGMLGIAIRLVAAINIEPYPYDFSTFFAWADGLAKYGLGDFYSKLTFIDYPPGYMYVLAIIGELHHTFGIAQHSIASALLLKAPAVLADIGIAIVVYRIGFEKRQAWLGGVLATAYFLNPVVWLNSSIWGQVDSVFSLLLLVAVWQLYKQKYSWAGIWYAIAILIKPQALLFGPVFLFSPLAKEPIKAWWNMFYAGVLTFIVGIFPFAMHQDPLWIYNLYKSTLGSYAYYSVNAFNVPALFGGNWKPIAESANLWSTLILLAIVASAGIFAWTSRERKSLPAFIGMWMILTVFLFAFKMHERYLFPALGFIPIVWLWTRDSRWLVVFILVTAAQFINVSLVYIQAIQNNQPFLFGNAGIQWSALTLLAAWLITLWIWLRPTERGQTIES